MDMNIPHSDIQTGNARCALRAAIFASLQNRDNIVISEFATVNEKDFRGFGFEWAWIPLFSDYEINQRVATKFPVVGERLPAL